MQKGRFFCTPAARYSKVLALFFFVIILWRGEFAAPVAAGLLAVLLTLVQAGALSPQELFRWCAKIPADDIAWKEFDKRYSQDLQIGICRVIGFPPSAKFQELFRDVKQNVHVRLLDNDRRALLAFRGHSEGEARSYLRRVAVSVALNEVRRRQIIFRTSDGLPPDMPIDDPILRDVINRISLDQALNGQLRGRNKYRNILAFKLHAYDGCPSSEIARVLGMKVTARAVENQINRMRKKLQKSLRG